MDKYELVKQISQTCDMVERLMMENEMLKEQLRAMEAPTSANTSDDSVSIEAKLGKLTIEIDRKEMVNHFLEKDNGFYVQSSFLEPWDSSYPSFKYYKGNQNGWLEAVSRSVFEDSNHVLDDFTLAELKTLFRPHLIAIYREGVMRYNKQAEKEGEKNDD